MDDSECWTKFRFHKHDIFRLKNALHIPDVIRTYNRLIVSGEEALFIFLKRFSYPCRYSDMIPRFARPVPQYCVISTEIMNHIHLRSSHLLNDCNLLQPRDLELYCQHIQQKGAPLDNCFGFVDGTVRPTSRPSKNQRMINGHKNV